MLTSERRLSISTENESTDSNEINFKQRLIHVNNFEEMKSLEYFSSSDEIEEEYTKKEDEHYDDEEIDYDEYDWPVKAPKVKKIIKPEEKKKEETKGSTSQKVVSNQQQVIPASNAKEEEKEKLKEFRNQLDYKMDKLFEEREKFNPLYEEEPEVKVDLKPYEIIIKKFEVAGIKLKLVPKPTQFSTDRAAVEKDVQNFLMDIRTKLRGQYIIIYPGKDTKFEVVDIDTKLHQVVLSVQEPERALKVTRKVYRHKLQQYINVTNTVVSPSEERRFLIGKDDGHLFACRLKENSNTVIQAHKSLKPSVIKKKGDNYYRQGEWFFVRNSGLMDYPKRRWYRIIFSEGRLTIGRGRPHIAEEVIIIDKRTYVRGTVKHPDHKTLHFNEVYQVFSNNEKREVVARGLTWFD